MWAVVCRVVAAALLAFVTISPAPAADVPVDLELVLAVDASRSIDEWEYALQRDGYVSAFTDPEVLRAVRSGPLGRIAVVYVEWSNADEQATLVDWTAIGDAASAKGFAERLREQPRRFFARTSISGAIDYSVRMIERNGYAGTRRVIDVSGDGINNQGRPVTSARDDAVESGITINGLAIINDRPQRFVNPIALDEYFKEQVIGGPGAFLLVVRSFDSFAEAIRKKLVLEISGRARPAPSLAEERSTD